MALFLFVSTVAHAVTPIKTPTKNSAKSETYKDLIDKAYTLSLQHDRQQALTLLISAAKKETRKNAVPADLAAAIEEVASIFYSDKAQQLYELALSFKQTDPGLGMTKLSEASHIEPDNLSILIEMQRLQIGTGDCSGALRLGEKITELNPYSDIEKLHTGQAAVCVGKFDLFTATQPADLSKGPLAAYWQVADIERLFKKAQYNEALDLISQVEKQNPAYPEPQYWRWRIEGELQEKNDKSGQKYLTGCHKLTPRQFRDLNADPNLCRHVAEVENLLKKSHTL